MHNLSLNLSKGPQAAVQTHVHAQNSADEPSLKGKNNLISYADNENNIPFRQKWMIYFTGNETKLNLGR